MRVILNKWSIKDTCNCVKSLQHRKRTAPMTSTLCSSAERDGCVYKDFAPCPETQTVRSRGQQRDYHFFTAITYSSHFQMAKMDRQPRLLSVIVIFVTVLTLGSSASPPPWFNNAPTATPVSHQPRVIILGIAVFLYHPENTHKNLYGGFYIRR